MNPNVREVPRPCACTSVRKTARVLARTFDSALSDSGLNITQLAVMRAVLRHPHEPLTRVAEDLAMDRTSLYRALAALEKQRWVTLHHGPDARTRTAAITAAGESVLGRAEPGWATTQHALIERFGAAQWQTLVAELRRLADCARELGTSE
ncbi:MAG TPA: MarR family winged helix-turn-helix transcriptional regulator [Steroidobacteraceae bacterium]|jgi:DNA-binding MarR family transcriptional regulator|nr:MarR family winged helix-turn-helix transcriptional regulator [Steroidobacteraceae bacterium]